MRLGIVYALVASVVLLSGCMTAPQLPVELNQSVLSTKPNRVGVAMTALPKIDTSFPGAACLLCYAAASMANHQLTAHTQTLPYEDIPKLKNQMAELLSKKGAETVVISEEIMIDNLPDAANKGPNIALKDFSSLQKKYNIDRLVVLKIDLVGMERSYASYIPNSDPKAVLRGTGYMVNLASNSYEWYLPVNILKSADKDWDEPPKFPGLTNAYFHALELSKDSFLKPFRN